MSFTDLSDEEKQILMDVARQSIHCGLEKGIPLKINLSDYSTALQQERATFVTLNIHDHLRGCIGTLEAHQSLVEDVAEHAFAAAFRDPRFSPLNKSEEDKLDIHISMLTPTEPMSFTSEKDLLEQIQPGIDGLILETEYNRGTFLPSVWESLPDKKDFLNHLKMKAGLPSSFWRDDVKISRYQTLSIP